jgi:putative ABC transport system substrate-binding protein
VVQLKPDVILATSTGVIAALARATKSIPIVFAFAIDPVGSGIAASLARPGGNITGFTGFEPSMIGKYVQLLKEVAPTTTRVSLLYNPESHLGTSTDNFLRAFDATSYALGVTPAALPVGSLAEIENALAAGAPDSSVVVMFDLFLFNHRKTVVDLARRYRVPVICPLPEWAVIGGLIAYGPDPLDTYRLAPIYVDRILRGVNPKELPIQEPDKFELVINLKTAKALGITVPPSLLARADEVIE